MAAIGSEENFPILKEWREKGLIPPSCERVIIDIQHDDIVRVYCQSHADEAMLSPELFAGLGLNAEFVTPKPPKEPDEH